ncbi:hypothetical protein RJ640_003077 [Escallonia rubra]|uniref:Reverse transcriptase Ty1/copia-type domain-containing protein n=1 Tax=Escallonia rubra TaxID=112253 RepID=A0AA88UAF3_9ASTE|nr:hypothetical protein RJ640_003077 [Escallonia rubra]
MEERNNFAPAEEKNMEDAIFLTYRGNEECKKNVWYLDTGASNHMCGRKELFTDLDETIKGEVTFGDSSKIPMKGKGMFTNFKKAMTKEFEMTDIGEMSYFLGVEVKQMEDGIFMSQKKYAEQILSRFRMKDCNPVAIPAETDSNYGRDLDDRKSTSGYAFHIGSAIFSWSSKKQQIVALSTCEAEYIAAAACTCQAIWLKNILKELYLIEEGSTTIYIDNKSAIALAKNPVSHSRSKHIDTRQSPRNYDLVKLHNCRLSATALDVNSDTRCTASDCHYFGIALDFYWERFANLLPKTHIPALDTSYLSSHRSSGKLMDISIRHVLNKSISRSCVSMSHGFWNRFHSAAFKKRRSYI